MRVKACLVGSLIIALSAVRPATAGVINTYSTFAAWTTATAAGYSTIPFSTGSYGTSLTLSGVTFTTIGSESLQVIDTTGSMYWDYHTAWAIDPVAPINFVPTIFVSVPPGTTSIGLNLTTVSPYDDPLTITVDGATYNVASTSPAGGIAFFGATFDSPISSYEIQSTAGDYLFVDNVASGTASDTSGTGTGGDPSPTPEVATLLMIGAGLVGMRTVGSHLHFGV